MSDVNETELPGVGIRYDYETREGRRLGVLVHRTGRRELLIYSEVDPDASVSSISLDEGEARTLSELLGVSRIAEHLSELHQQVQGVALEWLTVEAGSRWVDQSLADAAVHTETGVSVVALVRGEETIPSPASTEVLLAGDIAVCVGTNNGLILAQAALRRSDQ